MYVYHHESQRIEAPSLIKIVNIHKKKNLRLKAIYLFIKRNRENVLYEHIQQGVRNCLHKLEKKIDHSLLSMHHSTSHGKSFTADIMNNEVPNQILKGDSKVLRGMHRWQNNGRVFTLNKCSEFGRALFLAGNRQKKIRKSQKMSYWLATNNGAMHTNQRTVQIKQGCKKSYWPLRLNNPIIL